MSAAHPTVPGAHPLDNPARASLTGPHAHFAERLGRVLRYPTDVSPWLALPDLPDAEDWADVAALAAPERPSPLRRCVSRRPVTGRSPSARRASSSSTTRWQRP